MYYQMIKALTLPTIYPQSFILLLVRPLILGLSLHSRKSQNAYMCNIYICIPPCKQDLEYVDYIPCWGLAPSLPCVVGITLNFIL